MGIVWTKSDPTRLMAEIRVIGDGIALEAEAAILLSVHDGAAKMQEIITASTTKTGEERAARGGGAPGRIDTGDMFNDVKSTTVKEGGIITGKFGWIFRPQDYYATQDNTPYSGKPPMHALLQGYVVAVEAATRRLIDLLRTGKVSP